MINKKVLFMITGIALSAMFIIAGCKLGGAGTPPKNIMKPYISVQPLSASYYTGPYDDNSLTYPGTPPELSVAVDDWDEEDGELSYQWYSFTDVEDFCATGGTAIAGATGTTYTPALTPVKDKSYYYYVTVTNSNDDALDETSATTRSEVAVISFSDPGDPLVPILSRTPANARYGWGAQLNALQVKAMVPIVPADKDNANIRLSYQWFSSGKNFSVTGATPIAQANQNMLIPDLSILELDDNYFFVVVTNELGKRAQIISIPAKITIERGKKAAAPRITTQPKDQLRFIGEEIRSLSVVADSVDRGVLSYQWYSNTAVSARGGAPVDGATGAEYTPAVNKDAAGVSYYYVVVTNYQENVTGEKTASVTSNPVKVQVGSVNSLTPIAYFIIPNPRGTHKEGPLGAEVDVSNTYQYIRGYGGMDVAWGNFPRTSQADTELMYDPERLGYNILRIMIRADNVDPGKTIADLLVGDRPDYYENVKIVNKYGGYVAAAPWTPPKDWKSNNSINGGGHLVKGYYKLFANYLRNFAQNMYDHGAPIYCISISNEPNYVAGYDGCEWEPEDARDFFKEVGHFTSGIRGYGGGREIPYVLTMNGESANTPNWNLAALRDPQSKAAIDLLARHIYGSRTDSLWNQNKALITKKDSNGKDVYMEVWMTEHNINSANATGYWNDSKWNYVWRYLNDVDLVIRMNNENAFVWWASKRFYSMVGDGQYGATDGSPLPRGWALSHYSRYTIDYNRIHLQLDPAQTSKTATGVTIANINQSGSVVNKSADDMDNTSPRITVFQSQDGESISMVLWTPTKIGDVDGCTGLGTIQVQFPDDFVVQGVSAHRSWGDRAQDLFQPDHTSVTLSANRKLAFITLPINQILSVKFTK